MVKNVNLCRIIMLNKKTAIIQQLDRIQGQ